MNMSYCMFENTASDMQQCFDKLADAVEDGQTKEQFLKGLSSPQERAGFNRLVELCSQFVDALDDFTEGDDNAG